MGNAESADLDAARDGAERRAVADVVHAISLDRRDKLQDLLHFDSQQDWLNVRLNDDGDTPLILAARAGSNSVAKLLLEAGCDVNLRNNNNYSALSVSLQRPREARVNGTHTTGQHARSPSRQHELACLLIAHGASGPPLTHFILDHLSCAGVVSDVIRVMPDLHCRQIGLLLQGSVWYNQKENVVCLLRRGVNVGVFWHTPFMPQISPNKSSNPGHIQERDGEVEYGLDCPADEQVVQQTKLSMIHDWRNDWNEGANPDAQFRAGLHLPADFIDMFIRVSTSVCVLSSIIEELLSYPPPSCEGPQIREDVPKLLVSAGYHISPPERTALAQKYGFSTESLGCSSTCQPESLRQLCRLTVRSSCRTNVAHSIANLVIPKSLKAFILLDVDVGGSDLLF